MEVYTITEGVPAPDLDFEGFPIEVYVVLRAVGTGQAVLARATYEGKTCLSALFAAQLYEGVTELFLFSRPGQSMATATDRRHHHVSVLTEDAKAYAEALGTKSFYIRTITRRKGFFKQRFKDWTEGQSAYGHLTATLEVT